MLVVSRHGVGTIAGDAHYCALLGIGMGLAMAGHNEANENSINGDNKVSSKTSK